MRIHEAVRDIDQIQETDARALSSDRWTTVALVGLGGACIVFGAMLLGGKRVSASTAKPDPLAELVAAQVAVQGKPASSPAVAGQASSRPSDLTASDVTFPTLLSDGEHPTTALAAVRNSNSPEAPVALPPPATERLSVVPLPAQNVLQASPVVTRPRDMLTRVAAEKGELSASSGPMVPAGKEGGYQLQVSSFRTEKEATQFSDQLRARGHKAYVQEANVAGRGTWYRVRVGPFATQHAAITYRSGFESKEHVVPFIVPPSKG
jgi:DedD protein